MKRSVRRAIIDSECLTTSKQILVPFDVAEHLRAKFQTQQFEEEHQKKVIQKVVVTYVDATQISRPVVRHKYARMPGMKKTFLFLAVRDAVVLQKTFSCWCDGCLHASAHGLVLKEDHFICEDCISPGLQWRETSVDREDSAGVAAARARTRARSRELRDQLRRSFAQCNAPVWVAIQNRGEDTVDQYWVGKVLGIQKIHTEGGTVEGVTGRRERYNEGDIEFRVEWYDRHESGGDERRIFSREHMDRQLCDYDFTFNSSELRAINLEMVQLPALDGPPLNVVQRQAPRGSAMAAQRKFRHILCATTEVRADPPSTLWEISTGSEALVLLHCCP